MKGLRRGDVTANYLRAIVYDLKRKHELTPIQWTVVEVNLA